MKQMIKTKKQGLLVVISGPSGCGKNTVVEELLKIRKNCYVSISYTSSLPRDKEIEGQDYYFVTKEKFEELIEKDAFLEYASYADHYYGSPKKEIKEHLDQGEDVILIIEIQGALKIKEKLDETVFIFILPPTMDELKRRLVNRKTEDQEKIDKRFKRAYEEINEVSKYNYVVVNDQIEDAAKKIDAILEAERCRVDRIEEVYLQTKEEESHEAILQDVKTFINENIKF